MTLTRMSKATRTQSFQKHTMPLPSWILCCTTSAQHPVVLLSVTVLGRVEQVVLMAALPSPQVDMFFSRSWAARQGLTLCLPSCGETGWSDDELTQGLVCPLGCIYFLSILVKHPEEQRFLVVRYRSAPSDTPKLDSAALLVSCHQHSVGPFHVPFSSSPVLIQSVAMKPLSHLL